MHVGVCSCPMSSLDMKHESFVSLVHQRLAALQEHFNPNRSLNRTGYQQIRYSYLNQYDGCDIKISRMKMYIY
jgi:hypothetical protein